MKSSKPKTTTLTCDKCTIGCTFSVNFDLMVRYYYNGVVNYLKRVDSKTWYMINTENGRWRLDDCIVDVLEISYQSWLLSLVVDI